MKAALVFVVNKKNLSTLVKLTADGVCRVALRLLHPEHLVIKSVSHRCFLVVVARCCSNYIEFFPCHRALVTKLLSQGYKVNRLFNTF